MEDHEKYLYIKFKINEDGKYFEGFFLSEDQNRVNQWDPDNVDEDPPKKNSAEQTDSIFRSIWDEFEHSMIVFQRSVPAIMSSMPYVQKYMDDLSIRGYARQNGERLQTGRFETYKLTLEHANELTRRFERAAAINAGVGSLPSLFFVGLISAFDAFLTQLIRGIFLTKPEILSGSDKNISFKDLVEIGSVEAAREQIIEKEVESVLRSSHADQIKWLEAKLGIPLRANVGLWSEFIEACERRNLMTHTGGVVSSQYLMVCREHSADTGNCVVGDKLNIGRKYYSRSVATVLEFGTKLTQVVWRKLCPGEVDFADKELSDFGYRLIDQRRYGLAAKMLKFGLYEMKKHGTEAVRRRMVVNYANALKLSGDKAAAEATLKAEDWSASTEDYRICVAAVNDDIDAVIAMMKGAVSRGSIDLTHIRTWPVFLNLRTDAKFIEAFEAIFGEKLFAEQGSLSPHSRSAETGEREEEVVESDQAPGEEFTEGQTIH